MKPGNADVLALAFYMALDDECMDRLAGSTNPKAQELASVLGSLLGLASARAGLISISATLSILDADGQEVGRKTTAPEPANPELRLPRTAREWAAIPEVEDDPALQSLAAQCVHLAKALAGPDGTGTLLRWARRQWEADEPRVPNRRPDPLLPVIEGGTLSPERERGRRLFGGVRVAAEVHRSERLPLFPAKQAPAILRVPLLAMADAAGRPIMAKGRGAPLAFRLPVEAMLAVEHEDRGRESVRIAWTVRDLRDGLFPRGWARRSGEGRPDDWERVRRALFEADSRWIPLPDGFPVKRWRPFALRGEPGPGAALDDLVIAEVAIPPGSGNGPPIDRPALRMLGVDSGPKYRAFLAVESANWIPGVTRVPNPKHGGRLGWTGDRTRYPVFTAQDRRELAFGADDRRNRTRAEVDGAFEDLPGAAIIGRAEVDRRTGARGWRIVPDAAAEAIRRREARSGNRGE